MFEIDWHIVIMTVFKVAWEMSLYGLHNVILKVSLKSDTKYVWWISILNLHFNTLLIFSHTTVLHNAAKFGHAINNSYGLGITNS